MNICLVSQEYPPLSQGGGIGTQTLAKANGFAAMGHTVTVVTAGKDDVRTDTESGGVRVVRIPGFHPRMEVYTEAAAWLTYSCEVAAAIAELNRGDRFDLIDFPEWASEGFVHLMNRTEWNHTTTVVQIHGPLAMFRETAGWPKVGSDLDRVGSLMERLCLETSDGVYSSSAHSAEWCGKAYGLSREIPVLHTGVDTDQFCPLPVAKAERPTVLFAGRIDPQKGVDTLFAACHLLLGEFPDLELRLIGRSTSPLAQELLARESGLLRYAGFVPHEELPAEFSRAHVFAAPSIGEGGPGFVYLEAMSCGLPAIACRETGAAEAIVDGVTGVLVSKNAVEEVAHALRDLLRDPERRERMGAAARRHVVETAERRECLRRIEAYYRGIVA